MRIIEIRSRDTPDLELLDDLRKVAEALGRSPTIDLYNERGRFHASTLARRFGSWTKALTAAGLDQTRSQINIPVEDLLANIEAVWEQLGRQPRYSEMESAASRYSAKTYSNRFGSWAKALLAFAESLDGEVTTTPMRNGTPQRTRHINWRTRFLVLQRDGHRCVSCGRSPATHPGVTLEPDHIIPWSKGGDSTKENLRSLCGDCNRGRSNIE